MEGDEKLPDGWIKVKSRTRPDKSYFYNQKLKVSLWKLQDLKNFHQSGQESGERISNGIKKTPIKSPRKNVFSLPKTKRSLVGTAPQSRNIAKKNVARDRMVKLRKVLENEVERGSHKDLKQIQNLEKTKEKKSNQQACQQVPCLPSIRKRNNASVRMKQLNNSLQDEIKTTKQEVSSSQMFKNQKESVKESQLVMRKSDSSVNDVEMEDMSSPRHSKPTQLIEDFEPMEWEDVPELEVITKVQNVRTASPQSTSVYTSQDRIKRSENRFIIVVDTNVLLSNIDFVKEIKGKVFKDIGKATIFLPYIVLCELDKLKASNDNVARLARRAVTFIDESFRVKDEFLIGQSAANSKVQIIPIGCGDDKILNCCLQLLRETTKKVILLTNDKNLRNKAFVNKIEAFSRDMLNFIEFNVKNEINFE